MAKPKLIYVCNECGAEYSQWFGLCKACNGYGSISEEPREVSVSGSRAGWQGRSASRQKSAGVAAPRMALKFSQIQNDLQRRFPSGYRELDRVLGGGIVPGSLVLIGGDPGIGKSTLMLQVASKLAYSLPRILYVAAEESGQQVKLRAERLERVAREQVSEQELADNPENSLFIMPETDLEEILRELDALKPQVVVIDSIQTLHFAALTSSPGSVAQVRECTSALMRVAKRDNICLLIVGHVTKEGAIAGPRVLEHLVDTVLYFEGDRYASHRLLRSVKNRFGATHEIGIFEMAEGGLMEVDNPSQLFLGSRDEAAPGTATIVACEGTRPLMVEIQALVSPTSYPSPRRSTAGIDYNRLQQILAVLEKRVGVPLSKLDAYVSSVGGLGVGEPAADLGVAIAIVASFRDRVVDPRTVIIGEVGLGGQVRLASQMELRLKEAAKLGFKKAIVPQGQTLPMNLGLEIVPIAKVIEGIVAALPSERSSKAVGAPKKLDHKKS